jgi:hypothetical protein
VKTRVIPTFCAITPERIGVHPVLSVRINGRDLNNVRDEGDRDKAARRFRAFSP